MKVVHYDRAVYYETHISISRNHNFVNHCVSKTRVDSEVGTAKTYVHKSSAKKPNKTKGI